MTNIWNNCISIYFTSVSLNQIKETVHFFIPGTISYTGASAQCPTMGATTQPRGCNVGPQLLQKDENRGNNP